jgi:hypothetical protein
MPSDGRSFKEAPEHRRNFPGNAAQAGLALP